ncbi:MAG: hypothetical protein V4687_00920 [Bacteroidota bacterium]
MNTLKLLKVPQVAVKYLFLSAILTLLTFQAANCQKISGKFKDGCQTFSFVNGRFENIICGDINGEIGRGTYKIKNGILTLNYELIINGRDSSNYSLEYRAGALRHTLVSFKIFDDAKSPMFGRLYFRDKQWNIIAVSESSKDGQGTVWLSHDSVIRYIELESMGFNSVVINIDRLRKAHYDLIANMVPMVKYYTEPKVVKYKVLESAPGKLKLMEEDKGSLKLFREN